MTSVSSVSVTPTTPSKDILLLQKDIFTIYLEPLLKIHHRSTSVTAPDVNVITYEDLTSSFQLAVASLGKTNTNVDVNGKNFVRQKLIALHQSQIQAYHVAAKKALMEWANSVTLPEINISIHDTVTSYIKSSRAVTITARPIWRDATVSLSSSSSKSSSTSAKKELPVNEMAMNIIEERAKAHFEKQQENKERASQHIKTTITMENIPEEGEEDEDGEIDESDNTKDIVAMDATEEGVKNDFNNDTADTDDGVINEDGTNASTAIVSSNSTEVKVNATKTKPIIPLKKNIVSLHNKSNSNKPHQPQSSQTTAPPPSKRAVPTTKAKSVPIKKTNVTKPMTSTAQQQYRNNNATMNNNNSSSSSHRGNTGGRGSTNIHNSNNNPNIGRSGGGLRGGGGRGNSGSGK